MLRLLFNFEYPLSWVVWIFAITVTIAFFNFKKTAWACAGITAFLTLSITPLGANAWLNSVAYVTGVDELICSENEISEGILLPAGVVWYGSEPVLTHWAKARKNASREYINASRLTRLIIPGGTVHWGKSEGDYLRDSLLSNNSKAVDIDVGTGSHSTYTNFLELKPLLDPNKQYYLFTSEWHMYRAFHVAKNLGIRVCPVLIKGQNKMNKWVVYPWKFKVAIREYLAIAMYSFQGKI